MRTGRNDGALRSMGSRGIGLSGLLCIFHEWQTNLKYDLNIFEFPTLSSGNLNLNSSRPASHFIGFLLKNTGQGPCTGWLNSQVTDQHPQWCMAGTSDKNQ